MLNNFSNKKDSEKLKIYQCCGTEDFLYEMNTKIIKSFSKTLFDRYCYHENLGNHDWFYWTSELELIFNFFEINE